MSRLAVMFLLMAAGASGCRSFALRTGNDVVSAPAMLVEPDADLTEPKAPTATPVPESISQSFNASPIASNLATDWSALAGKAPLCGELWDSGCAKDQGPPLSKKVSVGIRESPYNCLSDELKAVNAFVQVTHGEDRTWHVGWSYSGSGKQLFPVPRAQHSWRLSDKVQLNAGVMLPNMVDPTFDMSLSIRR